MFEDQFIASKGQPIFYHERKLQMIEKIPLRKGGERFLFEILSTNSNWRQGVALRVKAGEIAIDSSTFANKVVTLWADSTPSKISLSVSSMDNKLIVYNVWDTGNGILQSWHNGAAMIVEHDETVRTFHCNDGYPDDDFNDLIFRLTTQSEADRLSYETL